MKLRKILAVVLALALLCTTLAACGNDAGSGTSSGSASSGADAGDTATGTSGGTLNLRSTMEPTSLNSLLATYAYDFTPMQAMIECLYRKDENDVPQPAAAETIDVSDDGLTYTFHLREGVTFHNGQPLTSADVLYTYNNLAGMGGEKAVSSKFENVESFEATDDYTFVIKLKEPSSGFLSLNIIAVLPEGYEDQATAPVGTGPFKFVEYVPSQRVVLEKNPDYYDEDRMAQVDRVEFYIMTDSAAVVSALQSGTLDIASVNADDAAVLEGQYDIYNSPQNMVQIFAMNNSVAPFDDVRVRQAINYAIDKDQIIDSVFGGYATKLYTNFSPVMGVYYNEELEGSYDTDVEKAKELLKEAGLEDGFTFTITAPANYQAHIDTAQIIAQQLQQVGITANIETMEWATWLEDVYGNAQYEATIVGLTGKLDPDAVLGRFKTTYPKNFFKFSNEEYDQLITSALTEQDEQTRIDDYKRCQEILTEQAAAAFISDPNLVVACRKDLKGYTFYPVTFHDMTKLYYEG